LRSGLDPIAAVAEINPVYVELKDLLLRKLALDSQRHHCFEQFPAERATTERKTISGELLRDTTRTFLG
jgi:hypothetical protein